MSTIIEETIVMRLLREYYNECLYVLDLYDNEDMSRDESEEQLILLDHEYAGKIVKSLTMGI